MTAFEERTTVELASTQTEAIAPARVTLSVEVADRLLELLCGDDAFRARFEASPRAALAELGHETPAAHLGLFGLDPVMSFSHFEGGLASKEKLAAAREKMRQGFRRLNDPEIFGPFDACG